MGITYKSKCKQCKKRHYQTYNSLACYGAYYLDLDSWTISKRRWHFAKLKYVAKQNAK